MRGMIIIQFNDFAYLAEGEHYMNEKQYLRANKRVFLAVTIIFAYITLTMLAALAASHGDHFVRIMIQCLVSVGVIILSALGYLTRKKTHTCAIILTTAMMVGYAADACGAKLSIRRTIFTSRNTLFIIFISRSFR